MTPSHPSIWQQIRTFRWLQLLILWIVVSVWAETAAAPVFLPGMHEAAGYPGHKIHLSAVAFSPLQTMGIVAATLAVSAILCGLYILLSRWLERRLVTEFEHVRAGRRLVIGAVVGFALFSAVLGIIAAFGSVAVAKNHQAFVGVMSIASVACAPLFEELKVRGVWLRLLQDMYGSWPALIVSSLFFGIGHAFNPNATLWSDISVGLSAGVLMGTAYIATGSLWLPIGLHFGWNFAEGDFWGAPDSGNAIPGIFHTDTHGSGWITGGAFGPEASVIAPLLSLMAGAYYYRLAVKRGLWVPLKIEHFSPQVWRGR